jgi:hypothetical protein
MLAPDHLSQFAGGTRRRHRPFKPGRMEIVHFLVRCHPGGSMIGTLKTLAAAGLFAAAASVAGASPAGMAQVADGVGSGIVQVHGDHRSCKKDWLGWHRHNRHGERRHCREWDGRGRRPDYCVKVGPIWICDY